MIEEDTIKLLRECNAGIKMGVNAIDQVLPNTKEPGLTKALTTAKKSHEELEVRTKDLLNQYEDTPKEPNPMAKGMSWLKTNVMLAVDQEDSTVADLITDGCNMGVKSLSKYLNQYPGADEKSKNIAKELIALEDTLTKDIRGYL